MAMRFFSESWFWAPKLWYTRSAGVPQTTQDTLVAEYNDLDGVTKIFAEHGNAGGGHYEPVAGNSGCILAK